MDPASKVCETLNDSTSMSSCLPHRHPSLTLLSDKKETLNLYQSYQKSY